MDIGETLGVWVHTLATVIVLGYYGILGRIVMPALVKSLGPAALGRTIAAVEGRAFPLVVAALIAFGVTGAYLLAIDPEFSGLGNYGASRWNSLMLAKHVLVGLLVVGGIGVHMLAVGVGDPNLTEEELRRDVSRVRLAAEAMTALGAIILLLTAAAQVG